MIEFFFFLSPKPVEETKICFSKKMFQSIVLLAVLSSACAFTTLTMVQEGFSKSLPFLKKPKNLDGLVVRNISVVVQYLKQLIYFFYSSGKL
jgi:hypothetical protein